jgi:hypothetical protein
MAVTPSTDGTPRKVRVKDLDARSGAGRRHDKRNWNRITFGDPIRESHHGVVNTRHSHDWLNAVRSDVEIPNPEVEVVVCWRNAGDPNCDRIA